MKYGWQHFSGTDYDAGNDKTGIFRIVGDNKHWSNSVDNESGNADFLMFADVDFAHPEVQKDVIAWGEWIVNECKLSGFRFDAVQHFSQNFTNDFVQNLEQKFGKDKLFCVGEFWVGKTETLTGWLNTMHHKFSLFDAPLLYNFSKLSTTENADLRSVFDNTLVKAEPYNSVTLVMNHDTQPGQTVETPIQGFFKPLAYALILLRQEGYPQLFYGDLYGMKGEHPEPVACGGKLPDLALVRKLYAYGDQEDYFDEQNCIGFVRRGTWDHPAGLACVMSNTGPGQKKVSQHMYPSSCKGSPRQVANFSADGCRRYAQRPGLDRCPWMGAKGSDNRR
jgi:alpha-amylase